MAGSNGGRVVPPPVPVTVTQIGLVVAGIEKALKACTGNLGWGP